MYKNVCTFILNGDKFMQISGWDWDEGNIEKCQKHGVSLEIIEEFLFADPRIVEDRTHSTLEARFTAFDKFNGRILYVVFTLRIVDFKLRARCISARYAREKELEQFYGEV